jgi:hypothetical protein
MVQTSPGGTFARLIPGANAPIVNGLRYDRSGAAFAILRRCRASRHERATL